MHIDDGLQLIKKAIAENPNLDGFEYIIDKIENGLQELVGGRHEFEGPIKE